MRRPEEKQAFARRLSQALSFSRQQVRGATDIALQFNLRYPREPISKQTAHKWLTGQSMPAPDKVDVLAEWLGVSPHWLRFGPAESDSESDLPVVAAKPDTRLDPQKEAREISELILRLPMQQRHLIVALVRQLLGVGYTR